MKKIFSILLVIIYASPIFGFDLYSKYKAHNYFINDDVTATSSIKINKYITLDQPKINYGGLIFFTTGDKDKRNYWAQLIAILTTGIVIAFASLFTLVGGAIGNISEMIIFGGATDFVYFSNTGTFLDHSIANFADMFIILPIIILVSINTIKLFYYIVLLKLISK